MILPTLQELYTSQLTRLETQYSINIPLFGKNFLRAWAGVTAGTSWLLYKAIAKVQKNVFVDTADPESQGGTLERFGRVYLRRNPFPATAGEYTIQLDIDPSAIGNVIPAQTQFRSNDDSLNPAKLFILDSPFTIDGINIITIRALEAGIGSKLEPGNIVSLTGPIALVEKPAVVLTESTQPQAAEDLEDYRQKVIDAVSLEPQGGAGADYRLWAAEAQGVKQSYPYKNLLVENKVNLFVEATIVDSIDGKGTPTPAIFSAVETSIETPTIDRPSRKSITVDVNYLPVTPLDIDIIINGYNGLTPTIEAAIATSIGAFLDDVRPFVGSIDPLAAKNDLFGTNQIVALILAAQPGSVFGAIELYVGGPSPVTNYQFLFGEIPYLNTITYVP